MIVAIKNGTVIGYWMMVVPPSRPPLGHHMGYPDPLGVWVWIDGPPPEEKA